MQSDFAVACKEAKNRIVVPGVPIEKIRSAARQPITQWRRRAMAAAAAIVIVALLGVGVAFGGKLLRELRVWFPSGQTARMEISADSITMSYRVTASVLRRAVGGTPFRVVLPSGLPRGTRLHFVITLSGANGRALALAYSYPNSNGHAGVANFLLLSRSLRVSENARLFKLMSSITPRMILRTPPAGKIVHWFAGDETVILSGTLSDRQAERVRASMASTAPKTALAETIAMTGEIVSVGAPVTTDKAQHYRRAGVTGYLFDGTIVPDLVRAVGENSAAPASGSFVDIRFRRGTKPDVNFGPPSVPARGPVPKGTVFESVPAHNLRSIAATIRARSIKARGYDFLVYARDATCDSVLALPRGPERSHIQSYDVNFLTAAKC
jgi:hypothetical protein